MGSGVSRLASATRPATRADERRRKVPGTGRLVSNRDHDFRNGRLSRAASAFYSSASRRRRNGGPVRRTRPPGLQRQPDLRPSRRVRIQLPDGAGAPSGETEERGSLLPGGPRLLRIGVAKGRPHLLLLFRGRRSRPLYDVPRAQEPLRNGPVPVANATGAVTPVLVQRLHL